MHRLNSNVPKNSNVLSERDLLPWEELPMNVIDPLDLSLFPTLQVNHREDPHLLYDPVGLGLQLSLPDRPSLLLGTLAEDQVINFTPIFRSGLFQLRIRGVGTSCLCGVRVASPLGPWRSFAISGTRMVLDPQQSHRPSASKAPTGSCCAW